MRQICRVEIGGETNRKSVMAHRIDGQRTGPVRADGGWGKGLRCVDLRKITVPHFRVAAVQQPVDRCVYSNETTCTANVILRKYEIEETPKFAVCPATTEFKIAAVHSIPGIDNRLIIALLFCRAAVHLNRWRRKRYSFANLPYRLFACLTCGTLQWSVVSGQYLSPLASVCCVGPFALPFGHLFHRQRCPRSQLAAAHRGQVTRGYRRPAGPAAVQMLIT